MIGERFTVAIDRESDEVGIWDEGFGCYMVRLRPAGVGVKSKLIVELGIIANKLNEVYTLGHDDDGIIIVPPAKGGEHEDLS